MCVKKGHHASCTYANSDTITQNQGFCVNLDLVKAYNLKIFFGVIILCVSALFLHIESADSVDYAKHLF